MWRCTTWPPGGSGCRSLGCSAAAACSYRPMSRCRLAPPTTWPKPLRKRVAEGFGCLKLKVGARADDVEAVSRVREAIGPDMRIRLDANQGWNVREAVRVIRALEDRGCDVELIEQPVAAADLAGLAQVTSAVDTPVMADESVFGVRDLVELIRRRAADLVNVKLAKCGGLTAAAT